MKAAVEMTLYRAGKKDEQVTVVADIQFVGRKMLAMDMSAARRNGDWVELSTDEQVRAERSILADMAIALRALLDIEARKPRLVTVRNEES